MAWRLGPVDGDPAVRRYHKSMSSSLNPRATSVPLRQDALIIGLVGLAHSASHFSQLLLAPLFPWLKDAFDVSYAQLGFLMTLFFAVSCAVQALSGFVVDRLGPRPVLYLGLLLLGLAALGYSLSTGYWMLAASAVLGGIGNGVFHPVDYTLLNRKVSVPRLGHAYSVHGITGSLGWALAPALTVGLALAYSWRVALAAAAALIFCVLAALLGSHRHLDLSPAPAEKAGVPVADSGLDFLKIPAVWMCFAFFFLHAFVLSVIQAFAPEAARQLHDVPLPLVAVCLTVYMLGSAAGMVGGGFLAANPAHCERVVGAGFCMAAGVALVLALLKVPAQAVPVLFGVMGFVSGMAGPSRDMLVKRSTPENATGRVYGVVYGGLDIGQAVSPLAFGLLMDAGRFQGVLLGLALLQAVLVASAFHVRRVRRTVRVAA